MRTAIVTLLSLLCLGCATNSALAQASNSCKACSDQQRACMKNYPGPTCKTEFQICMKSCKK
jgi:hypothetical protein